MKVKFRYLILSLLAVFMICRTAVGQPVSPKVERQFNMAILSLIDDYELSAQLSDQSDVKAFLRLFDQPDQAVLFNDLMGTQSYQKTISPQEYVKIAGDAKLFLKTVVRNVRKVGEVSDEGGMLHRKIAFDKYLMIIDSSVYSGGDGGVFYDSASLYDSAPDFSLVADFVYDSSTSSCRIASISAQETKPSTVLDDSKYTVVLKSDGQYDSQLTSNGESVKFNDYNQGFAAYNDIELDNQNIKLNIMNEAEGSHYNVVGLKFKPLNFRFKLHGALSPSSAYVVNSSYDGISSSSNGFEFGADFGYERMPSQHMRIGFYVGASISMSSIGLSVDNLSYSYEMHQSEKREYSFSASEDISFTDLVFPVYLEAEFDLGKHIMLTLDAGAKAFMNWKTSLGDYKVNGTFAGAGINQTFSEFVSPVNYARNQWDVALFGRAELDVCLVKQLLYAYASAGYDYGFQPSYDSSSRTYFSNGESVYPFVYSSAANKDVAFRSLIGSVSYQRRSVQASFGLKFKF